MKEIEAKEYVTSAQVCKELQIKASTLRKYAGMFDDHSNGDSYFERSPNKDRLYSKKDIETLKRFIELKDKENYTLDTAIKEVIGLRHIGDTVNDIADNEVGIAENSDLKQALHALYITVSQQNSYLIEYQKQIEKKDEQIDRLEKIVEKLITSTATNQSESKEDVVAKHTNGFLKNLFNRS